MGDTEKIMLGDALFGGIDQNDFLNELYENMLYNHALLKLQPAEQQKHQVDVKAALRFSDLLSKSTLPEKADSHKMWAQAMIALLLELYPDDKVVSYCAGSVLSYVSNVQGQEVIKSDFKGTDLRERVFLAYMDELLRIPAEPERRFSAAQKRIYDRMDSGLFSYSLPFSMESSFITQMFIKEQIQQKGSLNFVRLVPSEASVCEVVEDTVKALGNLSEEMKYSVTTADDFPLEDNRNLILAVTPEQLLHLLNNQSEFIADYIFVEDVHKMTDRSRQWSSCQKVLTLLAEQNPRPHFIFSSCGIANPEVYLQAISRQPDREEALSCISAPVTPFVYLVNQERKSVCTFNDRTQKVSPVYGVSVESVAAMMKRINGSDQPELLTGRSLAYFSKSAAAVECAMKYAEGKSPVKDNDLQELANSITDFRAENYHLAWLIERGIAYYTDYLPEFIRQRIVSLFKQGKITTMFCTGACLNIHVSADNLFITDYRRDERHLSEAEFNELVGRAGRIEAGLSGQVFLFSDGDRVLEQEYLRLLCNPVQEATLPEQCDNVEEFPSTQIERLKAAISTDMHYPEACDGKFCKEKVCIFLKRISDIFEWDICSGEEDAEAESDQLDRYATVLIQWMEDRAIEEMQSTYKRQQIELKYDGNSCYDDTREIIGKIILSRLANYFRRFSDEYTALYGEGSLNNNNWYEFVKYGTIDKTRMVPENDWLSLGIGKL